MRINSDVIRLEMAKQRLKTKDLAEKSGISAQSISTILNRQTCFPANVGKIAKALGVEEETIIVSSD